MSGSARENWVKALLPAAIAVLAYAALINLSQQRQIKTLRKELDNARQSAVTEDALFALHQSLVAARSSLAGLQQSGDKAQQELQQHLQAFQAGAGPSSMVALGRMCRELSLSVLAQQAISEIQLSAERKAAFAELRKAAGNDAVEYRCLHVAGSYASVARLLERLPDELPRCVPLAVELLERLEDDAGTEREWKIYFLG